MPSQEETLEVLQQYLSSVAGSLRRDIEAGDLVASEGWEHALQCFRPIEALIEDWKEDLRTQLQTSSAEEAAEEEEIDLFSPGGSDEMLGYREAETGRSESTLEGSAEPITKVTKVFVIPTDAALADDHVSTADGPAPGSGTAAEIARGIGAVCAEHTGHPSRIDGMDGLVVAQYDFEDEAEAEIAQQLVEDRWGHLNVIARTVRED